MQFEIKLDRIGLACSYGEYQIRKWQFNKIELSEF